MKTNKYPTDFTMFMESVYFKSNITRHCGLTSIFLCYKY